MISKRISTYLYELVLDPKKMEEYWRNKEEALAKSGLTPDQQKVLLGQDHNAILKYMNSEEGTPLERDWIWPFDGEGEGHR